LHGDISAVSQVLTFGGGKRCREYGECSKFSGNFFLGEADVRLRAVAKSPLKLFVLLFINNNKAPSNNIKMATPSKLRSIYRSFLRELPSRPLAEKSKSPLQARIRNTIASETSTPIEQAEQFLQYVKAQRMYATLLERYNPGMNMEEEERVRLTARRVGMDLPEEYFAPTPDEGSGSGRSQ
jgi:ATP synthase assembly factor FMC1